MKINPVVILLMIFACSSKDGLHLDSRESAKLESLVSSFDSCILFYYHRSNEVAPYKLIGMKRENGEDSWYKINFSDSFVSLVGRETLLVDYTIQKRITIDEANPYLNALFKSNAFKVYVSEDNLVIDCIIYNASGDDYPETLDTDYIDFRVYSDTLNIKTKYLEPYKSHLKCPNKDELKKGHSDR